MNSEHEDRFRRWLGMYHDGMTDAEGAAYALLECIAGTGDVSYFLNSPAPIREALLASLERFKRSGSLVLIGPRSDAPYQDRSKHARAVIDCLIRSEVLPAAAAQIASRKPFFTGIEYLSGGEELAGALPSDPSLISAKIIGFNVHPSLPLWRSPKNGTIAVQLEWKRKHVVDEDSYHLIPIRSGVAQFELRTSRVDIHVNNMIVLSTIDSITIVHRPKKRTYPRDWLDITMDFGVSQGSVHCSEIHLQSLQWLNLEPEMKESWDLHFPNG